MSISRNKLRLHRKARVRAKISGSPERPRISVFASLRRMSVQVIDDISGKTLASSDTSKLKVKNDLAGAKKVGQDVAEKCLKKNIAEAVFDRSGYKYHGKVKALAEGAREKGLKF